MNDLDMTIQNKMSWCMLFVEHREFDGRDSLLGFTGR